MSSICKNLQKHVHILKNAGIENTTGGSLCAIQAYAHENRFSQIYEKSGAITHLYRWEVPQSPTRVLPLQKDIGEVSHRVGHGT